MITQQEIFDIVKSFSGKAKSQYICPENFTYQEKRWGLETVEIDFLAKDGSNNNFYKYYSITNPLDPNRFLPYEKEKIIVEFNYFSFFKKMEFLRSRNINEAKIFIEDVSEIFSLIRMKMLENQKNLEILAKEHIEQFEKITNEIKIAKEKIINIESKIISQITSSMGFSSVKIEQLNRLIEKMEIEQYQTKVTKNKLLGIIEDTNNVINSNNFRSFLSIEVFKEIYSIQEVEKTLKEEHYPINVISYFEKSTILKREHEMLDEKKQFISDNITHLFLREHKNDSKLNMIDALNIFYSRNSNGKGTFVPAFDAQSVIAKEIGINKACSPFIFVEDGGEKCLMQNPLFLSQSNEVFKRIMSGFVLSAIEHLLKEKKKVGDKNFDFIEENGVKGVYNYNLSKNFVNLRKGNDLRRITMHTDIFVVKNDLKENEKNALINLAEEVLDACDKILIGRNLDTKDEKEIDIIKEDFLNCLERIMRENDLKKILEETNLKKDNINTRRKI